MALNLVCAVLDRGPANLAEMAVLLAIADSADKDSGEAWPAHKTIARRSRQTDRSVRNVLKRLRAAGWLTWRENKRPNGSQASNVYTVNLEKLGETPRGNGGRNNVPPPRNDVPPPPEHGSAHAPERGSALEPSQKKETTRAARAASSPRRSAPDRPTVARPMGGGSGRSADVSENDTSARPADPWQRAASSAALGLKWLHPENGRWFPASSFAGEWEGASDSGVQAAIAAE